MKIYEYLFNHANIQDVVKSCTAAKVYWAKMFFFYF